MGGKKTQKEKSGIYRWCNLINGKVYIGLSIKLHTRYKQFTNWQNKYTTASKGTSRLDRARQKYPDIKFWEYTILEYCEFDKLAEREIYWIAQHNSTNRNVGYNVSPGGGVMSEETISKIRNAQKGRPLTPEHRKALGHPVRQYTKDGVFIREWDSPMEAERELHINHVGKACKGVILSAGGFLWKYVSDTTDIKEYAPRTSAKPILQCDMEGNVIREWESAREAGRTLGILDNAITANCRNHTNSYKGFKWRYKYESDFASQTRESHSVAQLDDEGNVIAIYHTLRQASKATGATTTNIHRTCKGVYKTAGSYKWRYATPEETAKLGEYNPLKWSEERRQMMREKYSGENNPNFGRKMSDEAKRKIILSKTGIKVKPETVVKRQRAVAQLDENDNVVKIWRSIKEAEQNVKGARHVSCICKGTASHTRTAGYKWRYATPEEITTLNNN